jgi:molybdenum cofactor cytidylyltransferase
VPSSLLRALAVEHSKGLFPIVAPLVENRRGNPLLFDRVTFADFGSLTGDVGGRALLSRHRTHYLPWPNPSLLLDVDRPEDYRRLLEACGHRESRS